jgi:hypothetical protein
MGDRRILTGFWWGNLNKRERKRDGRIFLKLPM